MSTENPGKSRTANLVGALGSARILKVGGKEVRINPKNGSDFSLEEMRSAIGGGYIEIVALNNGELLVCDEEGKIKGMRVNVAATQYARDRGHVGDIIVGDVLICRKTQVR